jgi:D-amino-acid oxidase
MKEIKALVVGGGVSGLTSAVVLLEAGWDVTVVAREWAPAIVSGVAGAIWYPYHVSHPDAAELAAQSAARFGELAARPETGVSHREAWHLHRVEGKAPAWAEGLPSYRRLRADELPAGYACGYSFEIPLIETPVYMPWLLGEVQRLGGRLETASVGSLDEVSESWPVVVNCSGLGARELAGDETMVPIRGQIVRVEPVSAGRLLFDEDDPVMPSYLIPRRDCTLVGGTTQYGDWNLVACEETTRLILERAAGLEPAVGEARVLDVLVGLRPGRSTVRLEAEQHRVRVIIHNYGHGGGGFTLSWGCAARVREMVEEALG